MLMQSWPAYESYTGPLGLQTLTDITGSHYGPNIESSENNGWGQWHRADHDGVGMDRTVATGTGYVGQYSPDVAKIYESTGTTPDDLLLFFHHVPYTWKLHDSKTVIQYLYDSHYDGAAQAAHFVDDWTSLKGRIDPELYADMLPRLQYQAGHAIVWRDAVVQYFLKLSGIPDAHGRAGHYPNRLEAEDAHLTGYKIIDVQPWEDSSGGKAVTCEGQRSCAAEWTYNGQPGRFNIAVQYFDLQGGDAKFTLTVDGHLHLLTLHGPPMPSSPLLALMGTTRHGASSTTSSSNAVTPSTSKEPLTVKTLRPLITSKSCLRPPSSGYGRSKYFSSSATSNLAGQDCLLDFQRARSRHAHSDLRCPPSVSRSRRGCPKPIRTTLGRLPHPQTFSQIH